MHEICLERQKNGVAGDEMSVPSDWLQRLRISTKEKRVVRSTYCILRICIMDYKFEEKRRDERKLFILDTEYELKGILCPCQIIDISSQGIKMRVKGILMAGDNIKISFDKHTITAKVVRVDGNIVGVMFEQLSNEELDYIMNLKTFQNLL